MSPALERIAPPAVILALALLRIALGDPFVAPPGDPAPRVEPPAISASARAVLEALARRIDAGGAEPPSDM